MPVSLETRKMFVAAYCVDAQGESAAKARETHLEGHLAYVAGLVDHLLIAGPLFGDDGQTVIGSLLVYKTDAVSQARGWLENDPYYAAGIWSSTSFHPFRGAIGEAVGGISW
jgi:uncharacterized protein YciI